MKRRVLVIDDDPGLRNGMAVLIKASGAEVLLAETVAEALERLASQPTHIVLDLNLPDGHGTAALRRVREEHLPIRVVVISGSSDPTLLAEAASLPPDALLKKPPDWDELLRYLDAA